MSSSLTSALYSPAEVSCPNLFLTVQVAYISDSARFRTSPTGIVPSVMSALYSLAERPLSDISDMLYDLTSHQVSFAQHTVRLRILQNRLLSIG